MRSVASPNSDMQIGHTNPSLTGASAFGTTDATAGAPSRARAPATTPSLGDESGDGESALVRSMDARSAPQSHCHWQFESQCVDSRSRQQCASVEEKDKLEHKRQPQGEQTRVLNNCVQWWRERETMLVNEPVTAVMTKTATIMLIALVACERSGCSSDGFT